jgi:DNA repair protein RecO (recombination protein O)
MFFKYSTPAFVFKKEERGEADQLFTVYTRDFGKLEILGKGIRKISSKLRSGMEIFYLSEIEFIQGKIYKTLTDAFLIEKFQNLRNDPKRLGIAYKIADDLGNFVRGEEPDERIWQLLNETFQKLNTSGTRRAGVKPKTYNLIYYYFFWNFISILGYKPELYFCPICQKKLKPEKLYFSSKEGGIICYDCSKKIRDKIEVKPEAVKILRKILEGDWKILSRLRNVEEYFKSIKEISKNYSLFISEKRNEKMKQL